MPSSIRIDSVQLTPGSRLGLAEPTMSCRWSIYGVIEEGPALMQRCRAGVQNLRPSEPWPGVGIEDWPQAFLVSGAPAEGAAAWGVALTVAMMRLARDPVDRGRVIENQHNRVIHIALPYQRKSIATEAMTFALRYLLTWLWPEEHDEAQQQKLKENFEQWLLAAQSGGLSPNGLRFAMAARQREIPISVMSGILRLGWGVHAAQMESSFTGRTGNIAARIAKQKTLTSRVLHAGGIPIPSTGVAADWPQAVKLAGKLGFPVVIKPSDQDQGLGVVPGIRDEAQLRIAYDAAAKFSPRAVIVEKHIGGHDHRMLVVGGELLMTTRRVPGGVVGDGVHSVTQLVDQVNADLRRGTTKRSLLIALKLDEEARACLAEQQLTPADVAAADRFVHLRRTANISTGGSAVDVSTEVHQDNRKVAERAAQLVGLDIAGVDFLCPDISRSWREVGGAVCEVNAQPGFRPHWLGDPGRDINGEIIDWLFRGKPSRIPVVAIAEGRGSAVAAKLLHAIWLRTGVTVGVCSSGGVWIGPHKILDRGRPDFSDTQLLLNEPGLQAAVIEMPVQMLARHGQPCDWYDLVAVLDTRELFSGPDAASKHDALLRLHAESLRRARSAIVLDADAQDVPMQLACAGTAQSILVALKEDSPSLHQHRGDGGSAVFLRAHDGETWIFLAEGVQQSPLMPLAAAGTKGSSDPEARESGVLFAIALAWAQGITIDVIRAGVSLTDA